MPKKHTVTATDPMQARRDVLKRVGSANATEKDREAFRAILNSEPHKWRLAGDMTMQARRTFIEGLTSSALAKEVMEHACEQLQKELAEPEDGPLEKLLIDVAVFAWLRLSVIEQGYTQSTTNSHAFSLGIYWEKRLNAAHKRFEKACVNLARVRKMLRPKVTNQLSIGAINALVSGSNELCAAAVSGLRNAKSALAVEPR